MRALVLSVLAVAMLLPVALQAEEPRTYDEMQHDLEALRRLQVPLVQRQLDSIDGRQIARGATWARELSLTEVVPDLVAVLERDTMRPGTVSHVALISVFDALIELDARVDASVLVPYAEREQAPPGQVAAVAILALRSGAPQTQLAVFDALDTRDDARLLEPWLALGNVLGRVRGPAGFAARLLARLEVELDVLVVDHEQRRRLAGRVGGGCGGWSGTLPPGYPPIRRYALIGAPRDGAALLADGPTPVYVHQVVDEPWASRSFQLHDRSRDRLAWIAARLRVEPDELPVQPVVTAYVRWTDASGLQPAIEVERDKVRAAWAELLGELLRQGWIRRGEAERLEPRIRLVLQDDREDRSEPLPELPSE